MLNSNSKLGRCDSHRKAQLSVQQPVKQIITTQMGDIKGEVKSNSGDVEITASGDALNVSNVSEQACTNTADKINHPSKL